MSLKSFARLPKLLQQVSKTNVVGLLPLEARLKEIVQTVETDIKSMLVKVSPNDLPAYMQLIQGSSQTESSLRLSYQFPDFQTAYMALNTLGVHAIRIGYTSPKEGSQRLIKIWNVYNRLVVQIGPQATQRETSVVSKSPQTVSEMDLFTGFLFSELIQRATNKSNSSKPSLNSSEGAFESALRSYQATNLTAL